MASSLNVSRSVDQSVFGLKEHPIHWRIVAQHELCFLDYSFLMVVKVSIFFSGKFRQSIYQRVEQTNN